MSNVEDHLEDAQTDSLRLKLAEIEAQVAEALASGSLEPLREVQGAALAREVSRAVSEAVKLQEGKPTPTTSREWGVRWSDDASVIVYAREPAARGLFNHYGQPGEQLVYRLVTDWKIEDRKKKD